MVAEPEQRMRFIRSPEVVPSMDLAAEIERVIAQLGVGSGVDARPGLSPYGQTESRVGTVNRPIQEGSPVPAASKPPVPEAAASGLSFLGESQREAAHAIRSALADRRAFVALTGAPGLGKTTLLATAVAALPGLPLRTIRIGDPAQVSAELATRIEQVVFEPTGQTPEGERHTVLVVDDAHTASPELLRCLTHIAVASQLNPRSPQVVLAGRPELWERLAAEEFAPLAEHIAVRPTLQPMSDEDTRGLIKHLLDQPRRISGQMLTGDAEQEVLRLAQGKPERIGAIVRSTLTLEDVQTRPPISTDMIRSAAAALDGPRQERGREGPVSTRTLALALMATALVAGGVVLATSDWSPGRMLATARDLPSRAVVLRRTPPMTLATARNATPVLAEAARRAPPAETSRPAPPSPVTEAQLKVPTLEPLPVSAMPADQDSADRAAAVESDKLPRPRPPVPASSDGHGQPLAATSNPPTSAVSTLAANRAPDPAGLPGPSPADVGVAAPRPSPLATIHANPAEAARLMHLAQTMASIGQLGDAREMFRASAAMGNVEVERQVSQDGGR